MKLNKDDALFTDLNLLADASESISCHHLTSIARLNDGEGVFLFTVTDNFGVEVPMIVGKAGPLSDRIKFIHRKYDGNAKPDYKNRYVAETLSEYAKKKILLNLFWFPCDKDKKNQVESEVANRYSPIFGKTSSPSTQKLLKNGSVFFDGQQKRKFDNVEF